MRGIGTHIKYIGRSDLNSFKSNGVLPASPIKSRIKFGVSLGFGRAIDFLINIEPHSQKLWHFNIDANRRERNKNYERDINFSPKTTLRL